MRLYLALALFVGVASAWPHLFETQNQRTSAGVSREELASRNVKLLTLLERIREPSADVEVTSISESFNPASNGELYNDGGEGATELVERFQAGKTRERGVYFSLFDEAQRNQMICLFNCLMNAKTFDTYFKTAAWARERLNEGLFSYALIASALNRDDLRGVKFPAPYEINPHFFVPTEVIQEAYRAQMRQTPKTISAGFTGTAKNIEQRVAYFGEDVGLEAHHYHWHIDFPFWWDSDKFGVKDRKGELFFYMHHQLNARFNAERLSNNLERVKALGWNEELEEGFAPHATYLTEGEFPARPDNMKFRDLPEVTLADMDRYTDRIREAVDKLVAEQKDGQSVSLSGDEGIDVLGSMIESSTSSPNPKYYGSIHNFCHMLLARITDPDGKYGLPPGVMEHFETSTRDPTFFRLHKFLDEIFRTYKNNIGPYDSSATNFPGVEVQAVKVTSQGASSAPNNLVTFFDDFEFDLNNALDHVEDRADVEIKTNIKRLNNEPFQYTIEVSSDASRFATFRVFLAPKYEAYGDEIELDDKRWDMIELDKFVAKIDSGSNQITRFSSESSVTIPDTLSFKTLKQQALDATNGDSTFQLNENFRHCGLPNRLLLPKGTPAGMDFELWVVASNWDEDKVDSSQDSLADTGSVSYCGQPRGKFPDKRAMGFPWDRPIPDFEQFVTPNMKKVDIKITHQGFA